MQSSKINQLYVHVRCPTRLHDISMANALRRNTIQSLQDNDERTRKRWSAVVNGKREVPWIDPKPSNTTGCRPASDPDDAVTKSLKNVFILPLVVVMIKGILLALYKAKKIPESFYKALQSDTTNYISNLMFLTLWIITILNYRDQRHNIITSLVTKKNIQGKEND